MPGSVNYKGFEALDQGAVHETGIKGLYRIRSSDQ
jgi:hypothetical protein